MQRKKRSESATVIRNSTRWSADEAMRILDEWGKSGESLSAFSRPRGIQAQRLSWWRKRLGWKPGTSASPAFVPVTVRATAREPTAATVDLGSVRVELRTLDDASTAFIVVLARALGDAS